MYNFVQKYFAQIVHFDIDNNMVILWGFCDCFIWIVVL